MEPAIDAMLTSARRAQESIMTATCVIRDPAPRWEWDPESRTEVEVPGPEVYRGICRWQRAGLSGRVIRAGGQGVPVGQFVGAIPWHATAVAADMVLEILTADDPALLGTYTLTEAEASSFATARRLHGERP